MERKKGKLLTRIINFTEMSIEALTFNSIFQHVPESTEQDDIVSKIYYQLDSHHPGATLTRCDCNRLRTAFGFRLAQFKGLVLGIVLDPDDKSFLGIYPLLLELFSLGIVPFCFGRDEPWIWVQEALESLSVSAVISVQGVLEKKFRQIRDFFDHETDIGYEAFGVFCLMTKSKMDLEGVTRLSNDIAYVAQTSGTTGRRKSVLVTWDSIGRNILDFGNEFKLDSGIASKILSVSPSSFDPFYIDILLSHLKGAHIIFLSSRLKANPKALKKVLLDQRVSPDFVQITPTLYAGLVTAPGQAFKISDHVVLGGESFPNHLQHCPESKFYQAYGVTEMSCWQSLIHVPDPNAAQIPIHDPGANLLNETMIELIETEGPLEEETEHKGNETCGLVLVKSLTRICHILDHGLVQDSADEKNTNAKEDRDKYNVFSVRTGDLGIRRDDGKIYFLRRTKDYLKIQGKRTSVQEIESLLSRVLRTRILCIQDDLEHVVAFHMSVDKTDHRAQSLDQGVPSHLIPNRFIHVPKFPINEGSGKVNRKELMKMAGNSNTLKRKKSCIASQVWQKYVRAVPKDNSRFLEQGGDSFLAVQLASEVQECLGLDLPDLVDILLNGTFKDFQSCIDNSKNAKQVKIETFNGHLEPYPDISRETLGTDKDSCVLSLAWSLDLGKCIDASPLVIPCDGEQTSSVCIGSHSGAFVKADLQTGREHWRIHLPDRIESTAHFGQAGILVGCYDQHLYCLCPERGTIRWKFKTGGCVKASPLLKMVSGQGLVLFGSYDHHFYCLDWETGQCVWRRNISGASITVKACSSSSRVYVATLNGILAALELGTGNLVFNVNLHGPVFSSPALIPDTDQLVVANAKGTVQAVSGEDGSMGWTFQAGNPIFSGITVSGHFALFGCHDHLVYILDHRSGALMSTIRHPGKVFAKPHVFKIHSEDWFALTLSTEGTLVMSSLEDFGKTQKMFKIGQDKKMTKIDSDLQDKMFKIGSDVNKGMSKMEVKSGDQDSGQRMFFSSPVVCEGKIVFGNRSNQLCAFNIETVDK